MGATMELVRWLPPILIGFYVLTRWRMYDRHRHVLESTITTGVLVLGSYGVVQYFLVPSWDAFWMVNSGMHSIGHPSPRQVRVFSMLDSPGPFAMILGTGLVMLFIKDGFFPIISAVPGYLSFLLCRVRGAWIGWMLAIGTIIWLVKGRLRTRLLVSLTAIVILTIPLAVQGPIADQTASRAQTLANIEQDGSYRARIALYQAVPQRILINPVGWGLGSRSMDSGVLMLFWNLGWFGGLSYIAGLSLMVFNLTHEATYFGKIVCGVAAAHLLQLLAGPEPLQQGPSVLFWSLMSLGIASKLSARSSKAHPRPVA